MLGHLDGDLRQVVHLMRALDADVGGGGQIRAAGAAAGRAVALRLIRVRHPRQPAAFCARLLPRLRCAAPRSRRLPFGLPRPGSTSSPDGGKDEFPELRDTIRSSRATRRASSAFSARSASTARSCSSSARLPGDYLIPGRARAAPGGRGRQTGHKPP